MSLNNLAARLSKVGSREEAVACAEEAVAAYRELVEKNRHASLPDLATSLNTLAVMLSEVGRREDALRAAEAPRVASEVGVAPNELSRLLARGSAGQKVRADMALAKTVDANGTPTFFANGTLLSECEQFFWRIEAGTWEEAQAIYHLRQGWEPYQPEGAAVPCPECGALHYPSGSGQCWRCDHHC